MPEDDEEPGELSPDEVRLAVDRIEQKKLAIQLIEAQRYVVKARTGVPICDDQDEMIDDVTERIGATAQAVWPGDDMPPLAEIAEGDWVDEVAGAEDESGTDAETGGKEE